MAKKNDALARRWPNGDGARCSCTSPDSARRRSPRSSACMPPSFAAICSGSAIQSAPGNPPTFRRRTSSRWQKMIFKPGPGQFDPTHPPLEKSMSPEDAAASWKDKKIYDLAVDGYGLRLTL